MGEVHFDPTNMYVLVLGSTYSFLKLARYPEAVLNSRHVIIAVAKLFWRDGKNAKARKWLRAQLDNIFTVHLEVHAQFHAGLEVG